MSGSRKAIKILAIISIVVGVIYALFGIMMCVGAPFLASSSVASANNEAISTSLAVSLIAFITIITAIVYILVGALGVRGANDPSKIGPFKIICYIDVVVTVLGCIGTIIGGTDGWLDPIAHCVLGLIIPVVLIVLCNNAQEEIQ